MPFILRNISWIIGEFPLCIISRIFLCYFFPEYFTYFTYFPLGQNVSIIAITILYTLFHCNSLQMWPGSAWLGPPRSTSTSNYCCGVPCWARQGLTGVLVLVTIVVDLDRESVTQWAASPGHAKANSRLWSAVTVVVAAVHLQTKLLAAGNIVHKN